MNKYEEVRQSITTKFNTVVWSKFIQTIKKYELINSNDSIAVCLSGGKDSFLLAVLFEMYKQYMNPSIQVKILLMDPGYDEENLELVMTNIAKLSLDVHIFKTRIFEVVKQTKSPCYGCAKMRRGALYNKAMELGCNKIALGHHYNDVIETTLMGMFYTGKFETMLPKLKSTNHKGMELIRPLYLIEEESILALWKYNKMNFIACACVVTKKTSCDSGQSKRKEIKELIKELKKSNPFLEQNLFMSLSNVYVEKILGYVDGEDKISFLDKY